MLTTNSENVYYKFTQIVDIPNPPKLKDDKYIELLCALGKKLLPKKIKGL